MKKVFLLLTWLLFCQLTFVWGQSSANFHANPRKIVIWRKVAGINDMNKHNYEVFIEDSLVQATDPQYQRIVLVSERDSLVKVVLTDATGILSEYIWDKDKILFIGIKPENSNLFTEEYYFEFGKFFYSKPPQTATKTERELLTKAQNAAIIGQKVATIIKKQATKSNK
jgi:hypothetical protein